MDDCVNVLKDWSWNGIAKREGGDDTIQIVVLLGWNETKYRRSC